MASERAERLRAPLFGDPPGYLRHRPEATLLYQLVERHYPQLAATREAAGRPLPRYVQEEFDAYLKCGRFERGFLRVRRSARGRRRRECRECCSDSGYRRRARCFKRARGGVLRAMNAGTTISREAASKRSRGGHGRGDHWIAFILLSGVAVHMAYEAIQDLLRKKPKIAVLEFHSFAKILVVSFATSLDALGFGIGLGVSEKPIPPFILSIGMWAFVSTLAGLFLARKLSRKSGPIMGLFGSVILGVVAFQMLKI